LSSKTQAQNADFSAIESLTVDARVAVQKFEVKLSAFDMSCAF